ncbi:hypothetical protein OG552_06750 [Streptomyces sp. NBC_01476]|uniref:hypothetical protein n=1 Tax=Streptomyces sp. NBC_01476 TaxID=2903881 RepID=UPI002E33C3C1|nr:hypothetical protein [Streptomyces sp. NBC_01476]
MTGPACDHVRVDLDGSPPPDRTLLACADVLYGAGGPQAAARLLRRHPGCLLVSVRDEHGQCTTLTRTGVLITAGPVRGGEEHALFASMVHRWLVAVSAAAAAHPGPAAGRGPEHPAGP